MLDIAEMNNLS